MFVFISRALHPSTNSKKLTHKYPKIRRYRECKGRLSRVFPIMSTPPTSSSPGTRKPPPNTLDHTIPQLVLSHTNLIISPISQPVSKSGEKSSSPANVKLPTADEMLEGQPPNQPRILKMSYEEFYQWRQILGTYKKQMKTQLLGIHKS